MKNNNKDSSLYNVLKTSKEVEGMLQGLCADLDRVEFSNSSQMIEEVRSTIYSLRSIYESLPKGKGRKDWVEAFKRHKSKISELCSSLIRESVSTGISNPIKSVTRNRIIINNGDSLDEEAISPRSFWKLYRLIAFITLCETSNQLVEVLRVITTVASLCKDFALIGKEIDEDVKAQLKEITELGEFPPSTIDWEAEFNESFRLIGEAVNSGDTSYLSPMMKSFVLTILRVRREFKLPELTPDNLKLTSASTGTRVSGETVPGSIACVLEKDNFDYDFSKFDNLTKYRPSDISSIPFSDFRIKSERNFSVAIPQHKDSMRIIHILTNSGHDRLTFFEKIHKTFLKALPADCLFRQFEGRNAMLQWHRDPRIRAINSLDLHGATNTMSLDWQRRATEELLLWLGMDKDDVSILMESWWYLMSLDTKIRLPYSGQLIRYSFASGQPMGFTDSFMSFSVLHHIASCTVERLAAKMGIVVVGYKIVGDDYVVALQKDEKQTFAHLYKEAMAFLNTECNLEKGYIYNQDIAGKQLRISEFCKFLICEGQDITPIPLGCLSQCSTTQGRLVLLGWLNTHSVYSRLNPDSISKFCGMDEDEKVSLHLLARMPLNNILNSSRGQFRVSQGYRKYDVRLIFAASVVFVKKMFLLRYLLEKNKNPDYIPNTIDFRSFRNGPIRKIMKKVLGSEFPNGVLRENCSNKFLFWLNQLQLTALANDIAIEDLLSEVLPGEDIRELLPSLVFLEPDTLISINRLVDTCAQIQAEVLEGDSFLSFVDDEVEQLLLSLQNLSLVSIDSTNHRFGKLERITQGFDFKRFYYETIECARKLDVSDESIADFVSICDENFSSTHNEEGWSCSPVHYSDWDDDNQMDDSSSDDGDEFWAQMLQD